MIVTAVFEAKQGKEMHLREELHAGAKESWKESGVRAYTVHEVKDKPGTFMNIEVYASEADFRSHLETPHVKSFLGKLDDLLANPLIVYQGTAIFSGESSKSAL
ncbi:MAG: putative quinol monooxygenase [Actinobacteria bacterium]|nr:putative quinol monooxygenase [Actinomycetota bacterium]